MRRVVRDLLRRVHDIWRAVQKRMMDAGLRIIIIYTDEVERNMGAELPKNDERRVQYLTNRLTKKDIRWSDINVPVHYTNSVHSRGVS